MVVIATVVGGGLACPWCARCSVQAGMGFGAGFAILLVAIILDRMTRRPAKANG